MVFTHLPSNLLLIAIAFAPTFPIAVALLLARVVLSQMDVPTRQAYVMALVEPGGAYPRRGLHEHRPVRRPARRTAPRGCLAVGGAGAPFFVAGTIKSAYDLILWRWFRGVPLPDEHRLPTSTSDEPVDVLVDST